MAARKWFQSRPSVLLCVVTLLGLASAAEGQAAAKKDDADGTFEGYCGLYSLYGALNVLGKPIQFDAILEPQYIGSRMGSSLEDLKLAAEDMGAHAVAMSGLGAESLMSADCPMILHVSAGEELRRYQHWVLYLGMRDGKLRIVDAPKAERLVPLSNLMARWNGVALFVSNKPINTVAVASRETGVALMYGAASFVLLLLSGFLLRHLRPREVRRAENVWRLVKETGSQMMLVLAIASACAASIHLIEPWGFLRNPSATSFVAAAHRASFLPKLSVDEIRQVDSETPVTLIDARFQRDFQRGHIDGAISVPVDLQPSELELALSGIPRSQPVVVYCQSRGCEFDERVAVRLAEEGFSDIRIFPGGWREYKEEVLTAPEK